MYKEATKQKLRVVTSKGPLSVEQLWDLSTVELDKLAVGLQESYDNSKGKSFLTKRSIRDKGLKLQFDIVLDILNTKVAEEELAANAKSDREHNQKILEIIAKKQDEGLANMSIAELKKQLK